MAKKFPPKGYSQLQYPLPHNFKFGFSLSAEGPTKDSTILPLLRATEQAVGVSAIEVNPRNANFAEDTGCIIHMGSIVPRINLSFSMAMTKEAIETDKCRQLKVNWMPIYIAFEDSLIAKDDKTGVEVEDILELQHDATNKDTYPLYSTVDLTGIVFSHAVSTVPFTEVFGDSGLGGNLIPESVAFDKELFYDALSYYTNSGMLSKVIGKMNTVILKRDKPFLYHSNNYTNPAVKRGNPYTFCGILFNCPQVLDGDQFFKAGDTTAVDHVHITGRVRFDEWNAEFDQSAI